MEVGNYFKTQIELLDLKIINNEKIEKFKKDPSNEKVLGKKLIKYIKKKRMIRGIHAKIGTNDYYWPLIGDMLNDVVADVKKNNISTDLQKRRALLKKYSLILRGIKKKLDEDNYKSIDKDVSKLSKKFDQSNFFYFQKVRMIELSDRTYDRTFSNLKSSIP